MMVWTMAQSNLLAGLKHKHASLLGELETVEQHLARAKASVERIPDLETQAAKLREAVDHVVGVLQHLDENFDPTTTKARKPWQRIVPFKAGECARLALDTLRRADEPMMVSEIALAILARVGFPDPDDQLLLRTCSAVDATCRSYKGRTLAVIPGRRPNRWYVIGSKAARHVQD